MSSPQPPIPTYRIDLSLPPASRYKTLATDLAPQMKELIPLFDAVLAMVIPWRKCRSVVEFLASLVLRRVFSTEETEELRGIAEASGVRMYFLVALNVLLDSLMGCTSGGALVVPKERKRQKRGMSGSEKGEADGEEGLRDRMMHFRTLDWTMDGLRSVLVTLEFVRSRSAEPERVLARSITYAGFVGCLTGVRENLSLSLNFRPNHHCATRSLSWHQLLVLFGFRQSIASMLRNTLLSPPQTFSEVVTSLETQKSAPCYLILCDGSSTTVIEKDLHTAKTRTSDSFIVHTNHDVLAELPGSQAQQAEKSSMLGLEEMLQESEDRRQCLQKKWTALAKRHAAKEGPVAVRESTLVKWVKEYPIMAECTHFACLMDPKMGTVRWIERGVESWSDGEEEEEHIDPELVETEPGMVEKGKKFRKPDGTMVSNLQLNRLGEAEDQNLATGDRTSEWVGQQNYKESEE